MGDEPKFGVGQIVSHTDGSLWHVTQVFKDIDTGYFHYVFQDPKHSSKSRSQLREDNAMMMFDAEPATVEKNTPPVDVYGEETFDL